VRTTGGSPSVPPPNLGFRMRFPFFTAAFFLTFAVSGFGESALMPVPAEMTRASGRLPLTGALGVSVKGYDDGRLRAGLGRWLRWTEERTGLTFPRTLDAGETATLAIECGAAGPAVPTLGEDESYTLEITAARATLRAPTVVGALRGFATLQQLVQSDAGGWFLPIVNIRDQPRFPWRGLLIDVARHWQPLDVLKRNLDGMALVKLNVLHLHLTDDQGFRIESKTFPRLHEVGSDGHCFTQDEIKELVAYAAERGIRVMPEFDVPGHATSWVVGYPELASAPGPYALERRWGVFDPVLDPTNPRVYELLDGFLGEMAALFPDAYLHIGGDENNGKQWNANPAIQQYIRDHELKDNTGLHAYFNTRVNALLVKFGKQLVGWDEILHPDLPPTAVVQSWRGRQGLAKATQSGHPALLSNGYYIDLCQPAAGHYLNDPVPADGGLAAAQEKLVLGGEATMWAEWVTPETIDSRIWPRTAAIAERLWSPREVRDVPDMYRRLAAVSRRLEEIGLRHESYIDPALRRLAGDGATETELRGLREFVDLVEPVKDYRRPRQQPGTTQFTPLTGLVDAARPDSGPARAFAAKVEALLAAPGPDTAKPVVGQLGEWRVLASELLVGLAARAPRVQTVATLLHSLEEACQTGTDAAEALAAGKTLSREWLSAQAIVLDRAAQPQAALELPITKSLKRLAEAAAGQLLAAPPPAVKPVKQ
jgi:hexosaminidase